MRASITYQVGVFVICYLDCKGPNLTSGRAAEKMQEMIFGTIQKRLFIMNTSLSLTLEHVKRRECGYIEKKLK